MYSPQDFVTVYQRESELCVRLFRRIPSGGLDYRPTPGQRSTLELLRYLSYGPYNVIQRVLAGDWTLGRPTAEVVKDMPASDFPRNMRWQSGEVARLVLAADPVRLENDSFTFPWGETLKKGPALVNHPLQWLVAYKLQLFLYLKATGVKDIGTADLWRPPSAE
jgi:hypothetical protein